MSKAHMIVLGFLNEAPMYGYRIGQIVESKKFSIWAGIRLPSIYKAMQTLEQKGYIAGEQVSQGNNPPRTVYSINDKGRNYLTGLVDSYLTSQETFERDFWLALSFARKLLSREQLKTILNNRIQSIGSHLEYNFAAKCETMIKDGQIPIIHRHLVCFGDRCFRAEMEVMQELLDKLDGEEYNDFFKE